MLQKTTGIVLHTLRYNDTSNIVAIYTGQLGRISFLVRTGRSRRSLVKAAIFQPLNLVEIEMDYRNTSDLQRIKEAKISYPFRSIPYDPVKTAIGFYLAEFLYRAIREEAENFPLYSYLEHSIRWLDECGENYANFHLVFLLRLSRFLGLYPNLDNYREGDYFDLLNGCFTPTQPTHASFIPAEEAGRFYQLMRMNYETMHLFKMNHAERNRCLEVINAYYRLHLPDFPQLKSHAVLQELFGE